MTDEKKKQIFNKIEELLQLAKETNSPFVICFKECDEAKGQHFAAYGHGQDIVRMLQKCGAEYPEFWKILYATQRLPQY